MQFFMDKAKIQLKYHIFGQKTPFFSYSTLSKFLPIRVMKKPNKKKIAQQYQQQQPDHRRPTYAPRRPPSGRQEPPESRGRVHTDEFTRRVLYLAETRPECFCDELCVLYGDCCSDYRTVCPAVNCRTSGWSHWSPCRPEGGGPCGVGYRDRQRTILQNPENGAFYSWLLFLLLLF